MPVGRRRGHGLARTAVLVPALVALVAGCSADVVGGRPSNAVSSRGSPSGHASGNSSGSRPAPSGTLTWGESTGSASNLMPLISAGNSTANANLEVRVLDGLFRSAPNISYVPDTDQGTASSRLVGGRQVVTVRINPDAVWADGRPITADDYVFTAETQRSADPSDGGCAALLSTAGFDQIDTARALDQHTAQFTFRTGESYADWKGLFSGGSALLLSKHVVDQGSAAATCRYITRGWPVRGGVPLGAQNGPWLLRGENVDTARQTITLVPNPRYWGDRPKLARLVHRTIGVDADAAVRALRDGDVDVVYPQPQLDLVASLKQLPDVKTEISFGSAFEHLDFNTRDPLLKYRQIRRAIALVIDRQGLVASTVGRFSEQATPLGNRLLLNNQAGYQDNADEYRTQDIGTAKQLIESVGGQMGRDGIYRVAGRPLRFRVMTTQDNPLRDRTIQVLAQQAKAAGIALTEFANPDIFEGPDKPTSLASYGFQIALFAWVGSPSISSSDAIYFSPGKGGTSSLNYTRGGTPGIDAALSRVATAGTPQQQVTAANQADELLWDEMYTLPLYEKPTLLAYDANVSGLADNSTLAGPLWNSDEISVR